MTSPTRAARTLRPRLPVVLREERQYRLLFSGALLSLLGDRMTIVVLPFAVFAAGGGKAQVALVSTAQFLPFVLLSLPAGVWADHHDRRRILLASDATRMLCQATAAALLLTGHARVTHLAVIAAVFGAADALAAPAFVGLMPRTLSDPAHLQSANALLGMTMSTGSVLGPAFAGVLVATAGGPGTAIAVDAATFAFSFACMLRLRPTPRPEQGKAHDLQFFASLRDGWGEVRRRRWIGAFLLAIGTYHVVVLPAVFVLGPVLAQTTMHGASSWALITTGFGVGAMLGNVIALRWRPRHAMYAASLLLMAGSCQAVIIGSGLPVIAIAGLELLAGICVNNVWTLWDTSQQEHVPDVALSRVASYDYLTTTGLIPVGNVLAALVSSVVGLRTSMIGMSAIGICVAAFVAGRPSIRSLPRPQPAGAEV